MTYQPLLTGHFEVRVPCPGDCGADVTVSFAAALGDRPEMRDFDASCTCATGEQAYEARLALIAADLGKDPRRVYYGP